MKLLLKKIVWKFILTKKNKFPYIINNVDLETSIPKNKKALLLFKTFPLFLFKSTEDRHANEKEILLIIKSLNSNGYVVDVVDREYRGEITGKDYDVFMGIAAGNSGYLFNKIAASLTNSKIIALCLGPYPELSNLQINKRYDYFFKRNDVSKANQDKVQQMRLVDSIDFDATVSLSNILLVIGSLNSFSTNSYLHLNKKIIQYLPYTPSGFNKIKPMKKMSNFICFAGNGFIVKGVDLVIDAFLDLPEMSLEIYGPESDKLFFEFYGDKIKSSTNIFYGGFIDTNSSKFKQICERNSFQVFMSCSEGMATSVLTCMSNGIIPIVSYETSLDVEDFGFIIKEESFHKMKEKIKKNVICAANMGIQEFDDRRRKTIDYCKQFSQNMFLKNMDEVLKF